MDAGNETDSKGIKEDESKERSSLIVTAQSIKPEGTSNTTYNKMLRFGSVLHTWAEVSKINYLSELVLEELPQDKLLRSVSLLPRSLTNIKFIKEIKLDDTLIEKFPVNVTSLLNEDQLWGCFYNFPELYDDIYSPVVRIRNTEDVPEIENGVLTRDMVSACLSYLKRTPILGDLVYIKLDLSCKYLIDIQVLEHYKYIVYLDLSSNLLTDLNVLSNLLYLQYLNVDFNQLTEVLDYETPQWFLTEVHYKYNSVKNIQELTAFWSITVLDLSHNNIKQINGLSELIYLRRLDLSFNHIQRLENLNHLRLTWLDVSYNNISSFEFGSNKGLWTLLHLQYLNLNENNLTSMKIFSGCTRLRELYARNNRFGILLELAVYMRRMRSLVLLDLRSNPVCTIPGYKDVVINTFPLLLILDDKDLDPVEQRTLKMNMAPDVVTFATRRLLRLLYIQQLSRSQVSSYVLPADNTEVPIIILVGYEAVGKGTLARRLAMECSSNVELAIQHTTAFYHYTGHYNVTTRKTFDEMLLAGEFLTYSEIYGESYGLCREEAFVEGGKVKIVTMDLIGALMLRLRGHRPYLILTTCLDKQALTQRQLERKEARSMAYEKRFSNEIPMELSTLQVLLSGRIIINGILNEIIQSLIDNNERSDFVMDSQCSLMWDSDIRQKLKVKGIDRITLITSSSTSFREINKSDQDKSGRVDSSLHSLFKGSQAAEEYVSNVYGQASEQEKKQSKKVTDIRPSQKHMPSRKSIDFSKVVSSTWKGFIDPNSRKSSKSVTFTSPGNTGFMEQDSDISGMMIEPDAKPEKEADNSLLKSISARVTAWPRKEPAKGQDSDLWLAFLLENGLLQMSEISTLVPTHSYQDTKSDDPVSIVEQLDNYQKIPSEAFTTTIRDDYEDIHHQSPGLFWDTINMDNQEAAFKKMKNIIKDIVNSQKILKPMFDIDFAKMNHYPTVQRKLANICQQIAPQRLFY